MTPDCTDPDGKHETIVDELGAPIAVVCDHPPVDPEDGRMVSVEFRCDGRTFRVKVSTFDEGAVLSQAFSVREALRLLDAAAQALGRRVVPK